MTGHDLAKKNKGKKVESPFECDTKLCRGGGYVGFIFPRIFV